MPLDETNHVGGEEGLTVLMLYWLHVYDDNIKLAVKKFLALVVPSG